LSERLRIGLLLAIACFVYGNTLPNKFAYDDILYIAQNPAVTQPTLHDFFKPNEVTNVFRPLTIATFALNWKLGDTKPALFHLWNLLLHAVVTLLIYFLLKLLLEQFPDAPNIAFVAALIFAVHPIHTEAVASIVGFSELLAAAFLFAAWLLHLRDKPLLAWIAFVLALLSKESAIAFAPLVLAGDYACGKIKPLLRYVVIFATTLAYLGLLLKVQGGSYGTRVITYLDNPLAYLPAALRIPNALRIAWKYIWLQIYPAVLSCDYSYNAITLYANWHKLLPAVIATILVLALLGWAFFAKKREWFLAGAIYILAFAATSNVILRSGTIMGERLAYLPSLGFCLLVALLWMHLKNHYQTAAWAVLVLLVAVLGARTVIRNQDWRDNFTLFSKDVYAAPQSAKIHGNLGGEYKNLGKFELASAEFQKALAIYPDFPEVLEAYGLTKFQLGQDADTRARDAETRGQSTQALELYKQANDLYAEARKILQQALDKTSNNDTEYNYRVVNLAGVLVQLRDYDAAMNLLNQDVQQSPTFARAWANRAVVHYKRGELQSARADAQTALHLDSGNAQARNLLGILSSAAPGAPTP
jgi:protein O-mannosyl-transferase